MRELTTTSYALLGLLAIRPWTTYELAKQMERGMRHVWSRAESNVYEGPKALVEHGLATAKKEYTGKRPKTVYSITPRGRRALREWLSRPGAGPSLEFEALLKILVWDYGPKEQLVSNIAAARQWAESSAAIGDAVARGYVEEGEPFPGQSRLPVISLTFPLIWEFIRLVRHWAEWAEAEAGGWPDPPEAPSADVEVFRRALEREEAPWEGASVPEVAGAVSRPRPPSGAR